MSYMEKLKNIRGFVFDVDGVFTDGSIVLMPGGSMCRVMNVLDGYAVVQALKNGYKIGIITGGDDPMVKHRMEYLGIKDYYSKSPDKLIDYEDFKIKNLLNDDQLLMMGDDVPDIPVMKAVGFATCPKNAMPDVKAFADYISPVEGGKGAVRNIIEMVMKAQNKWHEDDTQSV